MYFSASTVNGSGLHCVGAATSPAPEGPYTALGHPLACPLAQGGAIDSSSFVDWEVKGPGWGYSSTYKKNMIVAEAKSWTDPKWWGGGNGGRRYMLYKIDGNTKGHGGPCGNTVEPIQPTPIMLQEVKSDGTTLVGDPVAILDNAGPADQGIVEAPSLGTT
jgi:hypothetical protein